MLVVAAVAIIFAVIAIGGTLAYVALRRVEMAREVAMLQALDAEKRARVAEEACALGLSLSIHKGCNRGASIDAVYARLA
mgnify:CR=1 FL=1